MQLSFFEGHLTPVRKLLESPSRLINIPSEKNGAEGELKLRELVAMQAKNAFNDARD